MSKLRRYCQEGNQYFITCVTFKRRPILHKHADILAAAIQKTKLKTLFAIPAWVILPDHFHAVIEPALPDLSSIMQRIKLAFAADYNRCVERQFGRVWQHRFWDHVIRDQYDFNRHIDYIHYNPVKHGLVDRPGDYEHSSYRKFREMGYYDEDWGVREDLKFKGNFGE
jgi:putative transposase